MPAINPYFDSASYPHILDRVIDFSATSVLLAFKSTSRELYTKIDPSPKTEHAVFARGTRGGRWFHTVDGVPIPFRFQENMRILDLGEGVRFGEPFILPPHVTTARVKIPQYVDTYTPIVDTVVLFLTLSRGHSGFLHGQNGTRHLVVNISHPLLDPWNFPIRNTCSIPGLEHLTILVNAAGPDGPMPEKVRWWICEMIALHGTSGWGRVDPVRTTIVTTDTQPLDWDKAASDNERFVKVYVLSLASLDKDPNALVELVHPDTYRETVGDDVFSLYTAW